MNDNVKLCVVLQGQLYPDIINELLFTYRNVKDVILSTWNTEDQTCIDMCKESGFNVILQDPPEYRIATNYQVKSLSSGFKRAIDMGYTHAFRCRTDIKINDITGLLELLKNNLPTDKLAFLLMYKNDKHSPEYLTDHIAYGPLDKLRDYWCVYQQPSDSRFIELFLMETYFNKTAITLDDIKDDVTFFQKLCYINNVRIEYTKPSYINQGDLVRRYYNSTAHPYFRDEWSNLNKF